MISQNTCRFAVKSAIFAALSISNAVIAAPVDSSAYNAAAPSERIVDVRADDCGITASDNPIRAFSKVMDRIDAVHAADAKNVVRLFPLSLGNPAVSNRNAVANRAIHFLTHKAKRTKWFDEKVKLPWRGSSVCPKTWSKRGDTFWWAERAREKQAEIDGLGGECELVFLGDSITHDWEREPGRPHWPYFKKAYKSINLGYGGDTIDELLWRAKYGELDGYKAKGIVLMVGANNRATPAEKMADGIGEIIKVIKEKQPQAKILLMAMIGRIGKEYDELRAKDDKASDIWLNRYVDGKSVFGLNIRHLFRKADGTGKFSLLPDGTHPSTQGERLWRNAALPFFEMMTGRKFVDYEPPIEPISFIWTNYRGSFADEAGARDAEAFADRAAKAGFGAVCLDADLDGCAKWSKETLGRFEKFMAGCRAKKLGFVPVVRTGESAQELCRIASPEKFLVFTNAAVAAGAPSRNMIRTAFDRIAAACPDAEILIWAQPFLRKVKELPVGATLVLGDENGGISVEQPRLHGLGWKTVMAPCLNHTRYELHRTRCMLRKYYGVPGEEGAIHWTDIADYHLLEDFADFVRDGADRPVEVPYAKVGIMTDNHITDSPSSLERSRLALELFKREGVDVVADLGDLGQANYEKGYDMYREMVDSIFPAKTSRPEFLYVHADHELYNPKGGMLSREEAFKRFRSHIGIEHPYFVERNCNGLPMLVFPQSLDLIGGLKSYEEKIAAACKANPGKPIVVFDHVPPYDTVYNSVMWGDRGMRHRRILDKYPQVVSVSGHSHNSILNERCIWQGTFTAVDAGCLQRWQGLTVGSPIKSNQGFGVMVLEAYTTKLVFRRFDVRDGREDRRDARWVVPVPFNPARAPYSSARRAKAERLTRFPSGSSVKVSTDAVPFSTVTVTFPSAECEDDVLFYRVDIDRRGKGGAWERFARGDTMSDFHLRGEDRKGVHSVDYSTGYFTGAGRYRISVTPVGFFGTCGEPISCEWTAPDPVSTELVWESKKTMEECPFRKGRVKTVEGCLKLPVLESENGWYSFDARSSGFIELPDGLWDGPVGAKFRLVFDFETEQSASEGFTVNIREINGWGQPCYGLATPGGKSGPLHFVFEFKKKKAEMPRYALRFERGGDYRLKVNRIAVERVLK